MREAHEAIALHLDDHYAFYGEELGVRIARKHLHWYTAALRDGGAFRAQVNAADSIERQRGAVVCYFARLAQDGDRLPYGDEVRGSAGAYEGEGQWEPEALAA